MIINDVYFNCELMDILIELKNELNSNGVELFAKMIDTSNDIQVCCPYHSNGHERRPSAGIRKSDGMFHCFACNEVHTLPEVISHCFGHTDDIIGKFGWQWLLKNFATVQTEERKDVYLDFERYNNADSVWNSGDMRTDIGGVNSNKQLDSRKAQKGKTEKRKTGTKFITEEELDKYRYFHPYMYKRGLTDDIIRLFDIGYDRDTGCITFPIRDIDGNTLFIARRSVKTKFFNYPEGVEKPLYGLYEIHKICTYDSDIDYIVFGDRIKGPRAGTWHSYPEEIIVCESMLDALSFWTVGKYAVALNGLGNELQFKQLRELPCRKIILATDSDEAGMKARKRIRKNIPNKLITEYLFPKGRKDANECTKEELMNLEEVF